MKPVDAKNFGEFLRARRHEKEMTIEQLAARLDKSKTYLSLVENGKREPSPGLIERLAAVLGGKVEDWKFLGLERDRLHRTLTDYPTQVQKFLRTISESGLRKR
jgi:transcriptional regulator with XRE-family HTH domain